MRGLKQYKTDPRQSKMCPVLSKRGLIWSSYVRDGPKEVHDSLNVVQDALREVLNGLKEIQHGLRQVLDGQMEVQDCIKEEQHGLTMSIKVQKRSISFYQLCQLLHKLFKIILILYMGHF